MMTSYGVEFLALATAHFLALISPGPDFFLIVGRTLRYGPGKAAWVCLGIALANGAYILCAIFGFQLIKESPMILTVMKYLGAVFMCYIGIMLLKAPERELVREEHAEERTDSAVSHLTVGFLSGILNPKNILFYFTLFTLFIGPETPRMIQGLYGVWMFFLVLFWDLGIAFMIGNPWMVRQLHWMIFKLEKGAGAVLLCFAVILVWP